eukprot:3880517-Pleurochrysis_carterae.AAC.1
MRMKINIQDSAAVALNKQIAKNTRLAGVRSRSDARVRLLLCAIVSREGLREHLPLPARPAAKSKRTLALAAHHSPGQVDPAKRVGPPGPEATAS